MQKPTSPLLQLDQWTAVASKCNPCPSSLDYHCPVSLNLEPAEPIPGCLLDALRTASQWMSEVAVAPERKLAMFSDVCSCLFSMQLK